MRNAPIGFERVAEAFDVAARGRLCESSGSEHSPENTMNLSDLIESYIEDENGGDGDEGGGGEEREREPDECERLSSAAELKETLRRLFSCDGDDQVRRDIVSETEEAYRAVGNVSARGIKRPLMSRLREKGFDAGLCKSKWQKSGHIPAGCYEYIDVDVSGTRYVVEVCLAQQFEIARPTDTYSSFLRNFPLIFVGKLKELKGVIRLTCDAIKLSMRSSEMALPPWRRFGYMQAKWFSSYKRTINESSAQRKDTGFDTINNTAQKRSVGFVPLPTPVSYCCRGEFASKAGSNAGQLAMEMNSNNLLL